MAITVGVNSYVTEAEATAYFAARYGYTVWAAEANKENALVSATQLLDLYCDWYGWPVSDSQLLAFPRDPDANPTPLAIKNSQCEIAYQIVVNGSVNTEPDDAIEELKAGSVSLKFKATSPSSPLINKTVDKMLRPYGFCSGSGSTKLIPIERQ